MFQDLRFSLRTLARKPGFVVASVLCLALGIGANVLIFGLVNAMLLRPIVGPTDPKRLVVILGRNDRNDFALTSYPDYQNYLERSRSFSGLLAYRGTMFNLNSDGFTERIQGSLVSSNYFSVLGVRAFAGRTFQTDIDQSPGGNPTAVISHGFWQRRFASDPAVIGKTIILNSFPVMIIGITQPGFIGTETGEIFDLWVPLSMQAQIMPQISDGLRDRANRWLLMIGRLKEDVDIHQGQEELTILSTQLREAYPNEHIGISGIQLSPHVGIGPVDYPIVSRFLGTVLAIVGLVLLIACANVANLLLVRAASRRKEIGVRLALGASRARIIRLFLTESVLLAITGASLGLLIPFFAKDWLVSLFPPVTLEALNFKPDLRVVGFTIVISLLTSLIFGIAPAIQSSRPDLVPELKESATTPGRHVRLSSVIVIAQIAISVTLLIGAGLLLRTMLRYAMIDPGFATDNVLALSLDLRALGYKEANGQQFYRQLIERSAALPGIESSSLASVMPLGWGSPDQAIFIEGQPPPSPDRPYRADQNVITPDWFRTMGISISHGRDFMVQDNADTPRIVIINETMAHRFWPGRNPIGRYFEVGDKERRKVEIVGVVRDSKHRMLDEEPRPLIYLPLSQQYQPQMILHLRCSVEPMSLVASIRREVRLLDANLPLFEIKTLAQRLKESIWPARTMSKLVVTFGLIALLLAVIGLYGVLSYSVTQRTREIGVRLALGARPPDVIRLILRQGMTLATIGVGVGLLAALLSVRVLKSFLSGVSAADPLTFVGSALLLIVVTLAASWIPARRAAKLDAMRALRHE